MTPLDKAITEIGTKENPFGTYCIKYNTWYYGQKVSGKAYPWCAVFIYWCYAKIGAKDRLKGVENKAYCPSYVEWAKANGKIKRKPARGYLVLFDWDKDGIADHIGFVDDYDNNDRTLKTIEGNHNHQVATVYRNYDNVLCYIDAQGAKNVKQTNTKKSINELALEVIDGLWGNGYERKRKLQSAGYSYKKVQARVNEILKSKPL